MPFRHLRMEEDILSLNQKYFETVLVRSFFYYDDISKINVRKLIYLAGYLLAKRVSEVMWGVEDFIKVLNQNYSVLDH